MSIGATIKKLRRERDMTQEQLAEFLGITANAVSQWECDRTAPDISQLPALANIFRVSADVLLGIDVETKDARIDEIYQEIRELWCTGQREQAEKLCREGLSQFPDSYILMEELAHYLSCSSNRSAKEESIALFERIRVGTQNEQTRNFAVGSLIPLYMNIGKQEAAKNLAESVPSLIYTKGQCRRMILRGADWADEMRMQIATSFSNIIIDLRNLLKAGNGNHPLFTDQELLVLWQKLISLAELFYENGDYSFDEQLLIHAHFNLARLHIALDDQKAALGELEKMLGHITHFDDYCDGLVGTHILLPQDKWPTSLLVRPRDENDGRIAMQVSCTSTENTAMDYLKKLSGGKFDAIRNHPRFVAVVEELKKTAHE